MPPQESQESNPVRIGTWNINATVGDKDWGQNKKSGTCKLDEVLDDITSLSQVVDVLFLTEVGARHKPQQAHEFHEVLAKGLKDKAKPHREMHFLGGSALVPFAILHHPDVKIEARPAPLQVVQLLQLSCKVLEQNSQMWHGAASGLGSAGNPTVQRLQAH